MVGELERRVCTHKAAKVSFQCTSQPSPSCTDGLSLQLTLHSQHTLTSLETVAELYTAKLGGASRSGLGGHKKPRTGPTKSYMREGNSQKAQSPVSLASSSSDEDYSYHAWRTVFNTFVPYISSPFQEAFPEHSTFRKLDANCLWKSPPH